MTTLLPCPFCGGLRLSIEDITPDSEIPPMMAVVCQDCTGRGPWASTRDEAASADSAAAAWNERVAPPQQLLFGQDGGGPRHFLAGRPVHAGDALELLDTREPPARWRRVRYEGRWHHAALVSALTGYVVFAREGDGEIETWRSVDGELFRWPKDGL